MDAGDFVVVLTGATGRIGSLLTFMLADQDIFGANKRISLRLIYKEPLNPKLKALAMEIQDCVLPNLKSVSINPLAKKSFQSVDCLILLGSHPRGQATIRNELLEKNALLFKDLAILCEGALKPTTKVLVIANPCNTNALVFSHFSPSLDSRNVTALCWLDVHRAKAAIARKLGVSCMAVRNVVAFGNHSPTVFIDTSRATINGFAQAKPSMTQGDEELKQKQSSGSRMLRELLSVEYLQRELQEFTRQRPGDIIQLKGDTAAYSAAKAAVDHLKAWYLGSQGEVVSMCVLSDSCIGIKQRLCVSLPVICDSGSYTIANLSLDRWSERELTQMALSLNELVSEKEAAFKYL